MMLLFSGCGRHAALQATPLRKIKHQRNGIWMVRPADDTIVFVLICLRTHVHPHKACGSGLSTVVFTFGSVVDGTEAAGESMVPKSIRAARDRLRVELLEHTWHLEQRRELDGRSRSGLGRQAQLDCTKPPTTATVDAAPKPLITADSALLLQCEAPQPAITEFFTLGHKSVRIGYCPPRGSKQEQQCT
ncbi:hypothetical protein NDU88_007686 [Pleurodeles waltl]|uniref:Uncharacterized protein n=1 Tax=Pleurodeles waltl TaxID=8319 RepID=A0AAV7N2R3_PLEWA|nr:hypothetical protein NDU88_007686 [Pleurodeles waltl]